jgi:ketosteroid isomerase-like protein
LDSPRVALIRRLFELMETDDLSRAAEELLANSAEDVVFEPHVSHGRVIRGHDELRKFWADFADEGLQVRAGAYSIAEEGDSVVVTGWVRTIDEGRLADTQSRWVYRFNDDDQVVSARVERAEAAAGRGASSAPPKQNSRPSARSESSSLR